jgi:hypothetical protein
MDTSPSPEEQEAQGETKAGPANPAPEGVDAPTPPGGPLRQDAAGGSLGGGHGETGSGSDGSDASDEDAGTIPIEDEQPDPGETPESDEETLREENAETSLDQPSDGVA